MSNYTTIDGETVHKAVAAAFYRMAPDFQRAMGDSLHISSGKRTHASQVKLFTTRYRVQLTGRGPFGDVKWWKGKRYVRYSSNGTVAVPGTSLHESDRAIDIRDSGTDPGVTRAGEPESNWIKNNAHKYGFNPRGFSFGEPWHLEFPGALTVPAADAISPITTEEEQHMDMIRYEERYVVKPGKTGQYHATYGTRTAEWIVFGPTWYKSITHAEAKQWVRILGHHSRVVEKADADLLKARIDALPQTSGAAPIDYDKLAAALTAAGGIPPAGSYTFTGTATPA